MAKFQPKTEMEKSLLNTITLLHNDGMFVWNTYEEIAGSLAAGFKIFNPEKREIYERINK